MRLTPLEWGLRAHNPAARGELLGAPRLGEIGANQKIINRP